MFFVGTVTRKITKLILYRLLMTL